MISQFLKQIILILIELCQKLIITLTKQNWKKKIPDVTDFVKKVKLAALENKIPDIRNLATKTLLTTVENKIPDVSNLKKKTDYNTKIIEIEINLIILIMINIYNSRV